MLKGNIQSLHTGSKDSRNLYSGCVGVLRDDFAVCIRVHRMRYRAKDTESAVGVVCIRLAQLCGGFRLETSFLYKRSVCRNKAVELWNTHVRSTASKDLGIRRSNLLDSWVEDKTPTTARLWDDTADQRRSLRERSNDVCILGTSWLSEENNFFLY